MGRQTASPARQAGGLAPSVPADGPEAPSLSLPAFDRTQHSRGRGDKAVWRAIASLVRARIESGAWQPGAKLPSVVALAAHFHVNPHTVRQALRLLTLENYLTAIRGRGTFVSGGARLILDLHAIPRFSTCVEAVGQEPEARLLRLRPVQAGHKVAGALGIGTAHDVQRLELLLLANDQPRGLGTYWFQVGRVDRLNMALRAEGSLAAALARLGVGCFQLGSTLVSARAASRAESTLLRVDPYSPVLLAEAVAVDEDGAVVFASQLVFNATQVAVKVPAPPVAAS